MTKEVFPQTARAPCASSTRFVFFLGVLHGKCTLCLSEIIGVRRPMRFVEFFFSSFLGVRGEKHLGILFKISLYDRMFTPLVLCLVPLGRQCYFRNHKKSCRNGTSCEVVKTCENGSYCYSLYNNKTSQVLVGLSFCLPSCLLV